MAEQEFTAEELNNETWKPVVGYEAFYAVSNLGRVKRMAPGPRTHVGRLLKRRMSSGGYPFVCLCGGQGKGIRFAVHTLVATAYLGVIPTGHEVNHIDHVKTNTRLHNLEYVTHQQNMKCAGRAGRMSHGHNGGCRKLKTSNVEEIRTRLLRGERPKDIAPYYGVRPHAIRAIKRGDTWRASSH